MTTKALLIVALVGLAASSGLAKRQLLQTAPAPGPACTDTVAQVATNAGLTTLLSAAQTAGLTATLSDPALAYTVFAPTNEAFVEALPVLNLTSATELLASPNLLAILQNHLAAYPLSSTYLLSVGNITTQYQNSTVSITQEAVGNSTLVEVATPVDTATVIMADIPACQSIVHVVNKVLIPQISGASSS